MEQDLGTVEAGRIADRVAVPGDPVADIRQMTKVRVMMKGGSVLRRTRAKYSTE